MDRSIRRGRNWHLNMAREVIAFVKPVEKSAGVLSERIVTPLADLLLFVILDLFPARTLTGLIDVIRHVGDGQRLRRDSLALAEKDKLPGGPSVGLDGFD